MPGIFGLVTKQPRAAAQSELHRMLEEVRHDPSYVFGTVESAELGVYVGWTARAGSFAARMPVYGEKRGVRLVFAGEEFSDSRGLSQFGGKGNDDSPGPEYLRIFTKMTLDFQEP